MDSATSQSSADFLSPPSRGVVTVIAGCMFSGKTTQLLRCISTYPPRKVLAIKHAIDTRYRGDAIVSHGGEAYTATPVSFAREMLGYVTPDVGLVAIDEGHFFDAALVDVVGKLAGLGMNVIITALDRDSWARPFPVVQRLVTLADDPIATSTVCARCGAIGDRTQRLTPTDGSDMAGGPERYEPRCRTCWTPPPAVFLD